MTEETVTAEELQQLEAELSEELDQRDAELDEDEDESDVMFVADQISALYESSGLSVYDFGSSFAVAMHRDGFVEGHVGADEAAIQNAESEIASANSRIRASRRVAEGATCSQ